MKKYFSCAGTVKNVLLSGVGCLGVLRLTAASSASWKLIPVRAGNAKSQISEDITAVPPLPFVPLSSSMPVAGVKNGVHHVFKNFVEMLALQ